MQSLWVDRTTFSTVHSFPGVISWFEVSEMKSVSQYKYMCHGCQVAMVSGAIMSIGNSILMPPSKFQMFKTNSQEMRVMHSFPLFYGDKSGPRTESLP